MKSAVIISGGNIEEDFALRFLAKNRFDYVIAADRGLEFLRKFKIMLIMYTKYNTIIVNKRKINSLEG